MAYVGSFCLQSVVAIASRSSASRQSVTIPYYAGAFKGSGPASVVVELRDITRGSMITGHVDII